MRSKGFSRRTLLKGLGIGAGLSPFIPLLNVSGQEMRQPKRLLLVYTPDGTTTSVDWKPTGTETAFTLRPILAPLAPLQSKIVVPWGLSMSASGAGEQHAYGMAGLWTASTLSGPSAGADFDGGNGNRTGWGSGPSVDQVVAAASGANTPYLNAPGAAMQETPYRTLELGVQCGSPGSVYRMIYKAANQPLHPETDPLAVFNRLFSMPIGDPNAVARKRAEQGAIIDLVKNDLARLRGRISSEEYPKVDAHLEGIYAIERRLSMTPTTVTGCAPPTKPAAAATSGANAAFPTETGAMFDLVVQALACDLTRVASVQLSRGFSGVVHSWLGQNTGHHTMSHDTTTNRIPELTAIDTWYATQVYNLLAKLNAIPEGNGTLLDNTLVVWGRELGTTLHRMQPFPVVLAGGPAVGLRPGRFIDVNNQPHAKLLVSICQMMGLPVTTFGNIAANSGPIATLA